MLGQTMLYVTSTDDTLLFVATNGAKFLFYHEQDCCESVYIEDIIGDLTDLIGEPILEAEEVSSYCEQRDDNDGSCTWTFYKFATIRGAVTVRWFGSSNGYYSESVNYKPTMPTQK
jgi:hypothetical protein